MAKHHIEESVSLSLSKDFSLSGDFNQCQGMGFHTVSV